MPILGGIFAVLILLALIVGIVIIQTVRWRRHGEKVLGYFLAGVMWAGIAWQITGNVIFAVLLVWFGVALAFLVKFTVHIFREIHSDFRERRRREEGLRNLERYEEKLEMAGHGESIEEMRQRWRKEAEEHESMLRLLEDTDRTIRETRARQKQMKEQLKKEAAAEAVEKI